MHVGIYEWTTFPACLLLPSLVIPGPNEPEARSESICASVARFAELEPGCVLFLTGPGEGSEIVREEIRRVGEVGARHSVRVALEPIHPSHGSSRSFVHTVDHALELIGDADVGILFDTSHLQEVSHLERIFGVHVADRREPTRSEFDRLLPGDGSRAAVRGHEAAGWDGWYDVELISDDRTFGYAFEDSLWTLPADGLARRSVESLEALA